MTEQVLTYAAFYSGGRLPVEVFHRELVWLRLTNWIERMLFLSCLAGGQ